jgi:UDP-3-O-[3-hydroxymyristoyl] glucosamine N-acyltransferase
MAQGKEDANGSMIKHTYSGEGVIADEVTIGSCRCTLSGGGLIADEVTIGSCRED